MDEAACDGVSTWPVGGGDLRDICRLLSAALRRRGVESEFGVGILNMSGRFVSGMIMHTYIQHCLTGG